MALVKCKMCGKFMSDGNELCEDCTLLAFKSFSDEKKEEAYQVVRRYVYDNPRTPKAQVAEETGVPLAMIHKWIKEGKLEEVLGETCELRCKDCGKRIPVGMLCATCGQRVLHSLRSSGQDKQKTGFYSK